MADYVEEDYKPSVTDVGPAHFLRGTSVEITRAANRSSPPEHVLFDFDGTLSLIREGWSEVMASMMVEVLLKIGTDESSDDLYRLAQHFIMKLNGKQTIYQMIRLAEEVTKRGGHAREPEDYKEIYHQKLMNRIGARREGLRRGRVKPEEMLVPQSLDILHALKAKGVRLYLASGTDEKYVREEAELLQLDSFFGDNVYGAVDDYKSFSKARVIERILGTNRVDGTQLLGFGDGYVEIQNIKSVGGTAVAVASDEAGRSGKPDAWKRSRLIGVGADVVIPDYQDYQQIVAYFWGED